MRTLDRLSKPKARSERSERRPIAAAKRRRAAVKLGIATFAWIAGGCECTDGSLIDARARLVVEPTSVDFGEVLVGGQKVASFQLTNKGLSTLAFTGFEIAGSSEIAFATPKPDALGPEGSIAFNVVFEPANAGEEMSAITIVADDSPDPRVVTLRGIGVEPGVGVAHDGEACGSTEGSLSFGRVVPGQTVERTITVTANGSATVNVLSAVAEPGTSGELTIDDTSTRLAPGESVAIVARYAPEDGGPDTGAFVITTDAPSAPSIRVAVCGEGVAPAVCARPNPLNLGAAAVGGTVSGTMTIESCGLEPVTVSNVRLSMDAAFPTAPGFALSGVPSLPITMQPGETFDVALAFTAAQLGPAQGHVNVTSTALNDTESYFPVIARGAQPCDLMVAPTSVTFANVSVGQNASRNVLLLNNGASSCTITGLAIAVGAPMFALSTPPALPLIVPAGQAVTVAVDYAPTTGGVTDMGRLDVDQGGAITSVDLIGNPDTSDGCHVDIVPAALNFGAVAPNTTRSLGVDVVNISSDPCFISGVTLAAGSDPAFVETSQNFGLILPNGTKQLSVTYAPSMPGSATGILEIETNDVVTGTFQVPLFAASAETGICVEPRHLAFGPTPGTTTMDFIIYACGSVDITVTALDWTTPDPEMSLLSPPALPLTLASGTNQSVTVQYASADMAGDTAIVTVRSDDAVEPAIDVTVTGGPELVPPTAGRYLYYWQIPNVTGGDIMQLPLQGATTPQPFWGPRTGKQCTGCHTVSPDGKYVAVVETGFVKIVDTRTNVALSLPNQLTGTSYFSWRPDVATNPPYQYAFDNGSDIEIGALFAGNLGALAGANDPGYFELMPTWGSNGQIAFARGTQVAGGSGGGSFGFQGTSDIYVVPETGGAPQLVMGAGNGGANYYPQFSPNGMWIAFTYSAMASGTIAATDAVLKMASSANTGVILDLPAANSAPGDGASSFPNWAVDGTFISFASNRAGGFGSWDIYIAPIDPMTGADGAATNLIDANTSAFEHGAQWSP
jgi:hypothetical protein